MPKMQPTNQPTILHSLTKHKTKETIKIVSKITCILLLDKQLKPASYFLSKKEEVKNILVHVVSEKGVCSFVGYFFSFI